MRRRFVGRMLSDMKMVTMRDLNRNTAKILDALERGQDFEIRRNGRAVGYLMQKAPPAERKPDWKAHFDWLRRQPTDGDGDILTEFEGDRRRLKCRDESLERPQ